VKRPAARIEVCLALTLNPQPIADVARPDEATSGAPQQVQHAQDETSAEALMRLERIVQHAPGLLYQFEMLPNQTSRFSYVSGNILGLFGMTAEQAMQDANAVISAIVPDDRALVIQATQDCVASLSKWSCEFRIRRPDGALRWLFGQATPQRMADGRTVLHGSVQDVTEGRELAQARQVAEVAAAANHAKTLFLSRMSHELRTPLNAVLGFAQLMEIDRSEPPGEVQRRRLKLIREAGDHLLHMIGDMLDLTRIEAGGLALTMQAVALRELASETLDMQRAAADKATVSLSLDGGGADCLVQADRTRLRQVLFNLIGNAIKYNRPGGQVRVHVEPAPNGQAVLTVTDTGVGISEGDLAHVFEPFQRGAQAQGAIEGAGIGLSVTQALVQLMGGRIQAQSQLGQGSVFSVWLPLHGATPPAAADHFST
jgi:PAS domain S-box-containing protein